MSAAPVKEVVKPDTKKELFDLFKRDFYSQRLTLGELVNGRKMKSIETVAYLRWIKKSAQSNKVSALLQIDGGYQVLSKQARKAFTMGAKADPPLTDEADDAAKEVFRLSLLRMAASQTALQNDREAQRKRSEDAAWFMASVVMPSILPEALRPFEAQWEKNIVPDHFKNMQDILAHVVSFQDNYGQLSENFDALLSEIHVATTHGAVSIVLSQFELFAALQKEYLTGADEEGNNVPLDSNYPPKSDAYLLEKIIKKLGEKEPISAYRSTAERWKLSFSALVVKLRQSLISYSPNEPDVPIRDRVVTLNTTVYQEDSIQYQPEGNDQQWGQYEQQWDHPVRANMGSIQHEQQWDYPVRANMGSIQQREDHWDYPVRANMGSIRQREDNVQHDQPFLQRRRVETCPFYAAGNCRFGDQCSNLHEQGEMTVKMSPAEYQQWQLQHMTTVNRNQQAVRTQQQGSAPSMHPSGVYRPPLPPSRGYNPEGRGVEPMFPPSRVVTYDQQQLNYGGRDQQQQINYGGRGSYGGRGDIYGGRSGRGNGGRQG